MRHYFCIKVTAFMIKRARSEWRSCCNSS